MQDWRIAHGPGLHGPPRQNASKNPSLQLQQIDELDTCVDLVLLGEGASTCFPFPAGPCNVLLREMALPCFKRGLRLYSSYLPPRRVSVAQSAPDVPVYVHTYMGDSLESISGPRDWDFGDSPSATPQPRPQEMRTRQSLPCVPTSKQRVGCLAKKQHKAARRLKTSKAFCTSRGHA